MFYDRCVWQEPPIVKEVLRDEEEEPVKQTRLGRTAQGTASLCRGPGSDQGFRVWLEQSGCGVSGGHWLEQQAGAGPGRAVGATPTCSDVIRRDVPKAEKAEQSDGSDFCF